MTEKLLKIINKASLALQESDLSDLKSVSNLKGKVQQIYDVLDSLENILKHLDDIEKTAPDHNKLDKAVSISTDFSYQKKKDTSPLPKANQSGKVINFEKPKIRKQFIPEKEKAVVKEKEEQQALTLNLVPEMELEATTLSKQRNLSPASQKTLRNNYPLSDSTIRDQEAFSEGILGPRISGRKNLSNLNLEVIQDDSYERRQEGFKIDTSKISLNDKMAFVNFFFNRSNDDYEQFIIKLKNEIYSLEAFNQTLIKEARLRNWDTESSLFQTFQRVLATSNKR